MRNRMLSRKTRTILKGGLGLLLLALSACSIVSPMEEVRIGVIAYLEGDYIEGSGQPTVEAARLAVNQVNEAGGVSVNDRRVHVELVIAGIEAGPERAVEAAARLINQEKVVAIVGPQFSGDAIPVARLAEEAGIPMISPMSTNPETTRDKRYVFRVSFIDDFQGRMMARFAYDELGLDRAAVLYDVASPYSSNLAQVFKQVFEELGGQVVAFESYTSDEAEEFDDQLAHIQAAQPRVLYLPNYEVGPQMHQARQMGLDTTIFLGSDGWGIYELSEEYPAAEGSFLTHHWHINNTNEQSRAFVAAYEEAYNNVPGNTSALTYDAFGLLFQAMQSAGGTGPASIQEGLYSMEPYHGVSGVIDYQENGDPVKSVAILQIGRGEVLFYNLVNP